MEFPADLQHLTSMLAFILEEARRHSIKDSPLRKLELASEEALVNIISYAYSSKDKERDAKKIVIECTKKEHHFFEVTIYDWGIPFNPLEMEMELGLDKPIHERKIGGLGIYLIRKLVDEASYTRETDKNAFRMFVRI